MKMTGICLTIFAAVSCVPLAHADIQLSYSVNGNAPVVCDSVPSADPNNTADCFLNPTTLPGSNVKVTLFSGEGIQASGDTEQDGATLKIQNTGLTKQTLTFWIADNNFSTPTAPPEILYSSNLNGTSTQGSGSVDLTSCVDTSNGLAPPTATFCSSPAATLVNTTFNFSGSSSDTNDTVSTFITTLGSPYTLSQVITLTLNAGASLNFNTSQVLTQVPEPGVIVLFGTVLVIIGSTRRKKPGLPTA